jgi:tetratricopeptide (TPR) repeat protein
MKKSVLIAYFVLFASGSIYAQNGLQEAWKALNNNDFTAAAAQFRAVLKTEPANTRAIAGLSYLLEMQHNYEESWNIYKKVINTEKDPYPYFYAIWLNPRFSTNMQNPATGVQDILNTLSKKADKNGILSAMAHEMLGGVEARKGNLQASRRHHEKIGALSQWKIAGPFENISASGYDAVYPPEMGYDTSAVFEGKNSVPVQWFMPPAIKNDFWLDFQAYFPDRQAFFYANTFVWSPIAQKVSLRVGTSGALKVFVNDAFVMGDSTETNNDFDTYITTTELEKGWNRILIKVGYSEIDRCNFLARITDDAGNPIPGLRESAFAQEYTRRKLILSIPAENQFINALKAKIAEHPDWLEHYLILADAYLRNDKAIEAELVLRKAAAQAPGNGLILWKFLDAYSRGRKRDELISTYEKLAALSRDIPDAAIYKFNQYLDNEDYDRADDMLARIERLLPERETAYSLRIRFYDRKKLTEKVIQTVREAWQKFPGSWNFTELAAIFDYQSTRKRDTMIAIYKRFLKTDYNENTLYALAKACLDDSRVEEWEKVYAQLLEYSPASPGYYFQMSTVYSQLEKYAKSEQMAREALRFCPSCNVYWTRLGQNFRAQKQNDKAREAYRKALEYSATDYDSREILRELEGKKSIFSLFGETNRDSLVKSAPTAADHPEASAAIVMDKVARVVYEKGASESVQETLIRVFNDKGIDFFKEYQIGFNGNAQTMVIEKAVTIKQDGTEVRADLNRNMAVFKGLEKNDFIYLKYKIRNYNSGKLGSHVWDQFYFNRFFPVRHAEYALLIPDEMQFTISQQKMDIESVRTEISDMKSSLYRWTLQNEPGIVYEADMPGLEETGKILRISTIPDWAFLVNWYSELARTKAQSSYEIREKIKEIIPDPSALSTQQKINKVFEYITENIRYSSVSFRQSAFTPQKARDVLVNRIGDCKDVSTLGIAMLRELGIQADYVLVNSGAEERMRNILPSIAFNHCIIAAYNEGDKRPLYLDFTAGNFPPGVIPGADRLAFSLLIRQGTNMPSLLPVTQIAAPTLTVRTTLSLNAQNTATIVADELFTGPVTAGLRARYRGKTADEQKKMKQTSLAVDLPNIKLKDLMVNGLDTLSTHLRMVYSCEVPGYMLEAGTYKIMRLPWRNELEPDEALAYEQRTYPLRNITGLDTTTEEINVLLPAGYEPVELPAPINLSHKTAEYSYALKSEKQGNMTILKATRRFIQKMTYVEPQDYQEFKEFYNKAVKEDRRQILLKKPD